MSDNRSDRTDNRQDTRSDLRDDRQDTRSDRRDNLSENRADRIDNREQWKGDRYERQQQVRDQFRDHHPRAAFWKDNPYWARFRWTRPYRWASWSALAGWYSWGNTGTSYSYGENIYYEDNSVYYGDEVVATADEYAQQAEAIATGAPEVAEDEEWMSLGVFAITQDGQPSGPPPSMYLQLALSRQGVIAGTLHNSQTEQTQQIEGAVDTKTQRSAWTVAGKNRPIMETGIANLTEDSGPALVHFEDGQTQQWLLVRLEDPDNPGGQ